MFNIDSLLKLKLVIYLLFILKKSQQIYKRKYIQYLIKLVSFLNISLLLMVFALIVSAQPQSNYKVKIKLLDRSEFPKIRLSFLLTDESDNVVRLNGESTFNIFENENLVATVKSSPSEIFTILVIDKSSSMDTQIALEKTSKINETIKAAGNFVKNSPENFQTGLLIFNTQADITQFSKDKTTLLSSINNIKTFGDTRLQDAIGTAIDLFKDKKGRKAIIVITDGRERSSKKYIGDKGRNDLIELAKKKGITVSVIGIGDDAITENMKPFENTYGKYMFSPGASEINQLIQELQENLKSEITVEYETLTKDAPGLEDTVRIESPGIASTNAPMTNCCVVPVLTTSQPNYTYFVLFFISFLSLAGLFPILSFVFASVKIFNFRRLNTRILKENSQYNGQKSPNSPSTEKPFCQGDIVWVCSLDKRAYSIRSWRYGRCKSQFHSKAPSENWCYQYNLPAWLRRFLHKYSIKKETETGKSWLCNCAGDKEGY